eukprot:COSAG01_NODE_1695_length_9464_cov_4.884677_4_plen_132_part_00
MGLWVCARNWLGFTYASAGTTLFLWQFPHFFSLAWLAKDDYARGQYRKAADLLSHVPTLSLGKPISGGHISVQLRGLQQWLVQARLRRSCGLRVGHGWFCLSARLRWVRPVVWARVRGGAHRHGAGVRRDG